MSPALPNRARVARVLPVLDFGGVESRVALQSRLHDRRRFDLRVCTFHKPGAAARAVAKAGVQVDCLNVSPSPRNVRATLKMAAYLRRLRPDILHASISEANVHCIAAAQLARVPVVIAEEVGAPEHGRLARLAFRALYRGADAVVGVTRATCDYVTQVDGAPADRVKLIYNCANPDYFPVQRARVAAERRPDPEPFRFLMVGRLATVKNHVTFLDAFARARPKRGRAELWIAGDGPLRAEIEAQIERLGLRSAVKMLGYREDVGTLLESADCYVLSSLAEGCSVSLVEAMASGVPAIGSRVSGITEVLRELSNECCVDAVDVEGWVRSIERMTSLDAAGRARLAKRGQELAYDHFSPSAYIANVEDMYLELLAAKGRPLPDIAPLVAGAA